MSKTVEKCVPAHRRCFTPLQDEAQDAVVEPSAGPPAIEGKRAANTRHHFAGVHEMHDTGVAIDVISKTLRMDRKTVRKYAHVTAVEDLLAPPRQSRRMVQPWAEYLTMRWQEGYTDSRRAFRKILERGYRSSSRSVRRWLEPLRSAGAPTPRRSEPPTVRQVTGWLTRHPTTPAPVSSFASSTSWPAGSRPPRAATCRLCGISPATSPRIWMP
ncbi:hypothetical protein [Streptomyces sp. SGAir0957]